MKYLYLVIIIPMPFLLIYGLTDATSEESIQIAMVFGGMLTVIFGGMAFVNSSWGQVIIENPLLVLGAVIQIVVAGLASWLVFYYLNLPETG